MRRAPAALAFAFAALLILLLTLAACAPSSSSSGPAGGAEPVRLTGAGSTFVYPIMSRWIGDYEQAHPDVEINYQSIGSGGGIQQVRNGTVQFGATDLPLSDVQLRSMPPLVQLAESGGPVCVTYNLPRLKTPLRLTGAILAGVYAGTITTWRDPAILAANPESALPKLPILVAHRSDGSGTTSIFTAYLSAVSSAWAKSIGHGLSVRWPAGLGGKGSEGVAGLVEQTEGAIGYVELTYAAANHLPVAAVLNPAGQWILPSAASATAAIAAGAAALARDLRAPVVNENAPGAYPITGLTFLLLPRGAGRQFAAARDFAAWVVGPGQALAAPLGYAPLPPALTRRDLRLLQ